MRLDEISAQATTDGFGNAALGGVSRHQTTTGLADAGLGDAIGGDGMKLDWIQAKTAPMLSELINSEKHSAVAMYILSHVDGAKDTDRATIYMTTNNGSRELHRIGYRDKYYQQMGRGRDAKIASFKRSANELNKKGSLR